MSNLKIVSDDQDFDARLKSAGNDLVVVDFFTTWYVIWDKCYYRIESSTTTTLLNIAKSICFCILIHIIIRILVITSKPVI
jgi:hypothetical protein